MGTTATADRGSGWLLSKNAVVPGVVALALIAVFWYLSPGLSLIVTFVPTMALAYVAHLLTTAREMPDPKRVLPVYLVAFSVQFLHFSEEFITGFYYRWPQEIFHAQPFHVKTFVLINMLSYCAFALGAVAIYKGVNGPMLIVWFFTIMGVVGNGIQHPIYSLLVGGYFPGLFTSLLYWVLGPVLFLRLWETRAEIHDKNGTASHA
ncbi:HXXEE domain-containing protein (plasmid) [Haladaptatus sp. SPP-AMP-3]|uniref:HXXEE domain-containing protein n=1 Tax=Haladaptatus sp. SPP-AMP-3 TaxID=3121295 RepID=UPI003C2CBDDB